MKETDFRHRIGEILGVHLAHSEQDLMDDAENTKALTKIKDISEAYRNFAVGDLTGFKADFDHGYEIGKRELQENLRAEMTPTSDLPNPGEPT